MKKLIVFLLSERYQSFFPKKIITVEIDIYKDKC